MEKKILSSVCLVIGIAILVTTGTSFAYFSASTEPNSNTINGTTMKFDVDLEVTPIHVATQLIPISNELIDEAIAKETNKCIDNKGYQVCTLYNVTLTNNGEAVVVNGYLETITTEYITDNLKCQLFDSNYNVVSDIMTISRTPNGEKYFMNSDNMTNTALGPNQDKSYYLVIWLYETGTPQSDDYSKNFSGKIGFEALSGETISSTFTS